ncbi:putative DNA-binding transcriptional regulator YafY [Paenibacillus phyllosphaerae]|uniref:Putative DNA-binding transcriptional regulator YafY n=1 Tax=Paenibacillus phyllosphaerae TaxID=274593 RepID=A0A7W5FP97_9BACL|nr:WYL domain-containing protein [Paenibacillus phyllosphaerae]MBB3112018.1 putative DNA-binding transcriptional regulator YafY [Paenibacillus phyllosphaerae]
MARESFDKEIQFLRMLALTSGAYNRQQFAERLGISVHTYDKTIRRLKSIRSTVSEELPSENGQELAESLRYNYYEATDPLLLFLYRAKSVKESESFRLSLLIAALQDQTLTAMELLDHCVASMPPEAALPDEKTLRSDLKYLEEVGVILREPGGRPYRYRLHNDLVTQLTDEELLHLYDFVDVMAGTQVPSVQGYLLRDSLKQTLRTRGIDPAKNEAFRYKYHYYSRILDEAHLHPLLAAIAERRIIRFVYYSPKAGKSYAAQHTNPVFSRESEGARVQMLPLRVVYDHQYGRWYLLGQTAKQQVAKFRLEGMTQLEEGEPVSEEEFARRLAVLDAKTKLSWLVDTSYPVKIRARFYNPEEARSNFVKERVLLQGQWGLITEEDDHSFVYEITVNGMTEIKPWLRSFGSSCEVLEPERLRQEFIAEWKEIQRYYEPI